MFLRLREADFQTHKQIDKERNSSSRLGTDALAGELETYKVNEFL